MKFDFTQIFHSRKAIEDAQIVIIPYNTLLHSSTREAINIQLENSVVIIDEAHNVLETIGMNYMIFLVIHCSEIYAWCKIHWNTSKFVMFWNMKNHVMFFHFVVVLLLCIFPNKCSGLCQHRLGHCVDQKHEIWYYKERLIWVFVFQKYGKS